MFADGLNVRIQCKAFDTGWRQPQTLARLSDDYQPVAIVELNLTHLRNQLKG
jgi:hypothetical protein